MSEVANTEKLIELVRERSLLYDLSDVDYKNRDKKAEAWLQIATALGFGDSKLWIAKWKSLRDSYGKFKKNNESSTGQSYKKYKTWPWASQMRFLDDYNVRRPTESNSQPSQATIDTTFHTDTNITDDSSVDMTVSDATPGPSKPFSRKRIRTSEDSSDKILEYLKNKNENKNKMDGVDYFFLSYAQSFKTFPPKIQSMVKLEMATLFARYELQLAEGSDANATRVSSQLSNQAGSSTPNSGSVPSPACAYELSSSSWAVPSPVSEQFLEPASPSAPSQDNNTVVYVRSRQSTPSSQQSTTLQTATEYYENVSRYVNT
ncbi:uncharacterized protein LOC125237166 [Leguminivora glycinivorella]|uniref:uncharacterized protein LOC125237166 n=1 Tax=Leguminivora glycinivorella TaxID=1035111 RepID=UPI00200FF918|nr:uncharacterized protein LOC125237166 [Leguminivora glycinivorella]